MLETIPLIDKKLDAFHNPRVFLADHNNVMKNILPYFFTTNSLAKAKAAILWQDVFGEGLEAAKEAKRSGKPVIVIEHGRWAFMDYLPPINYEFLADKLCVWGTRDYEWMINGGFSKDRIVLTGCPMFDGLNRDKVDHKGINIVFGPKHYDKELDENRDIMEALKKIKGVNIISKLFIAHDRSIYGKNVVTSRPGDRDHLDKCVSLLRKADVVVTNNLGTFPLLAMYFDIPVIYVDNFIPKPFCGNEVYLHLAPIPIKGVEIVKDLAKLESAIKKHLDNPALLQKERTEELMLTAGVGLEGSPARKIVDVILKSIEHE